MFFSFFSTVFQSKYIVAGFFFYPWIVFLQGTTLVICRNSSEGTIKEGERQCCTTDIELVFEAKKDLGSSLGSDTYTDSE